MTLNEIKYGLRRWAFGLGFGGAVLVMLTALTTDKVLGQDVLIISPHDESTVQLNRALYVSGDPVADLYGNPLSEPVRVILPAKDHLIRPQEDESLLLLKVDKQKGENPLQAQTVWFFARFALAGLTLLGITGFFLPRRKPERTAYKAAR